MIIYTEGVSQKSSRGIKYSCGLMVSKKSMDNKVRQEDTHVRVKLFFQKIHVRKDKRNIQRVTLVYE